MSSNEKSDNSNSEEELRVRESFWFRFQEYASRKLPTIFSSPHGKLFLEWARKNDQEKNKETRPPDEEQIQLHCLWATEFYTSSHAEDLVSAFVKLGWDMDDGSNNPASWTEQIRTSPSMGGCRNLGTLVPPNSQRLFLFQGHKIELPDHVKYATAYLFSISPSITCIVINFIFDADYRLIYDRALREYYHSYQRKLRRGWSDESPIFQKRDRIIELRKDIRKKTKKWFASNIPSVYCKADELDKHFPTCEFITLRNTEPFSENTIERKGKDWLDLLGIYHDWHAWDSNEINGLKFAWPIMRSEENLFHSVVSASEKSLMNIDMSMYGGHESSNYISLLNLKISELMSRWACLSLLRIHEERLFKIRDSKNYKDSNKKILIMLKNTQALVSESLDISTFAPELIRFAKEKLNFHYDGDTFIQSRIFGDIEPISLIEGLSRSIEFGSIRLLKLDRSLKGLIIEQVNLLSISENIKLQKRMTWLTVIMTFLTIIMTYGFLKDMSFFSKVRILLIEIFPFF